MTQMSERHSPLLPQYAFVLQLRTDTQVDAGRVTGRIEHVISGQATYFDSVQGFMTFIARVLQEVHEARAEQG